MLVFLKKQIFLLGIIIVGSGETVSYGAAFHPVVQKALDTLDQATVPLSRHVKCYTVCNQKMGRQGAGAFQDYFRQHADRSEKDILSQLKKTLLAESLDIEREARQALCCLDRCRVSVTMRFLAQFLGSIQDESLVRMIGVLFGATSRYAPSSKTPQSIAEGSGEDTKLFTIVFNKRFQHGCYRVLRHEKSKIKRLNRNLELLRQIYFEMYGPVHMAPQYVETYGL